MSSLPATGTTAPMALKLMIPAPSAASGIRPMYVSRNTKGLGISYGAHPATFPTITTPTLAADVSSGSSLCTTNGDGSRTCSIPIAAPSGTDDFQVTAWDAVPVSGSFAGANRLSGTTVLNQTITAGSANSLSFTLDGVVNNIALFVTPATLGATASGTTQTATLSVNATDLYGNIIIGSGNYTDASGNSLTISIGQSIVAPGGPVRTTLSSNTVTSSAANTVTVTYAGNSTYGTRFTATPSIPIAGISSGATLNVLPAAITEFAAGPGPTGITAGPDGNLWFAENNGNRIGRISTSGTLTEFSSGITGGSSPFGITTGPDGNLWFTEQNGNRIGRITPSGTVTEFPSGFPAPGAPDNITAGPDGNLWFTEVDSVNPNFIGRMTPSGSVTTFQSQIDLGFKSGGITTGPDGNLWFTDVEGNSIGVIPPDGTFTQSYVSGHSIQPFPFGIAAGPDGNLWFTEFFGNRVGWISPDGSGTVTEFSSGISASAQPKGITAGPDGNMWFTEYSGGFGGRIGRITPSGTVTEFSSGITAGSGPSYITTGPDGNLWFTEPNGNRIGRFIY